MFPATLFRPAAYLIGRPAGPAIVGRQSGGGHLAALFQSEATEKVQIMGYSTPKTPFNLAEFLSTPAKPKSMKFKSKYMRPPQADESEDDPAPPSPKPE